MVKPDNLVYLQHMLDSLQKVARYVKGYSFKRFSQDEKTVSATLREISIIGEAASRTTESFRKRYPNIKWKEILGTRNKLVHDYLGVRLDIVWETIKRHLPQLEKQIRAVLK